MNDDTEVQTLRRMQMKMKAQIAEREHYCEGLEAMFMIVSTQMIHVFARVSDVTLSEPTFEFNEADAIVQGLRHMASTSPNQQSRDAAREAIDLLERIARRGTP